MLTLNNQTVLNALHKHETLTIHDIAKKENLGFDADLSELKDILEKLQEERLVYALDNVTPTTYTITEKGFKEAQLIGKNV